MEEMITDQTALGEVLTRIYRGWQVDAYLRTPDEKVCTHVGGVIDRIRVIYLVRASERWNALYLRLDSGSSVTLPRVVLDRAQHDADVDAYLVRFSQSDGSTVSLTPPR